MTDRLGCSDVDQSGSPSDLVHCLEACTSLTGDRRGEGGALEQLQLASGHSAQEVGTLAPLMPYRVATWTRATLAGQADAGEPTLIASEPPRPEGELISLARTTSLSGQETLVASWRGLARQSTGATVLTTPTVVAARFPAWAPLNNAILLTEPSPQNAATAAAELDGLYRRAGIRSWAMWLPALVPNLIDPDHVTDVKGMRRDTTTLVMTLELTQAPLPAVGLVRTSIDAAARAGDGPIPASELPPPTTDTDVEAWVIIRGDLAVGGAWSFVNGVECGVYAVSTAPSWRRRGVARALMWGLLDAAYRRGARTASLQSTRMGEPLYRSLGFEPVGRYEEWVPG